MNSEREYKDGYEMRKMRRVNRKYSGFTLIEVLMAVLLIAILATIAITQFTNFARDTRNAATKENLGILRSAIQKHFGTMRLRCKVSGTLVNNYPARASLNANDITSGLSGCTSTDVPEIADRYFISGGIPVNPWSDKDCGANAYLVKDGSSINSSNMNVGTPLASTDLASITPVNCGWVYNNITGQIKAATNLNGTDREGYTESAY